MSSLSPACPRYRPRRRAWPRTPFGYSQIADPERSRGGGGFFASPDTLQSRCA